MVEKGGKSRTVANRRMKWQRKKEWELLYLGDLGDGSHLQNLEEPLVIGENALDFEGDGTDELLSKERNGLVRGTEEKEDG